MDSGELDESEEVVDVVFPSSDETAEVVHSGEEALDLPAFLIAAQLASVPRLAPVATSWLDLACLVRVANPANRRISRRHRIRLRGL